MAKTKLPKIDSLQKYLETCPNKMDSFTFDSDKEAYVYGQKLRDLTCKEEKVNFPDECKLFKVDISLNTVRIRLV